MYKICSYLSSILLILMWQDLNIIQFHSEVKIEVDPCGMMESALRIRFKAYMYVLERVFCVVFRKSCDERGFGMYWLPKQGVILRVSYRLSRITDQDI
jgi:hypothetical protein